MSCKHNLIVSQLFHPPTTEQIFISMFVILSVCSIYALSLFFFASINTEVKVNIIDPVKLGPTCQVHLLLFVFDALYLFVSAR